MKYYNSEYESASIEILENIVNESFIEKHKQQFDDELWCKVSILDNHILNSMKYIEKYQEHFTDEVWNNILCRHKISCDDLNKYKQHFNELHWEIICGYQTHLTKEFIAENIVKMNGTCITFVCTHQEKVSADEIEDLFGSALKNTDYLVLYDRYGYIRRIAATNIYIDECVDGNDVCAICRCGDDLKYTTCKHVYHKECLDQWVIVHGTCPMCRKILQ